MQQTRHEAQSHADRQRQRREEFAEQIQEFVRGDHAVPADEPEQHRRQPYRGKRAEQHRLEGADAAPREVKQHRFAELAGERIEDRRKEHQRHDQPQLPQEPLSADAAQREAYRAEEADSRNRRVLRHHGKQQNEDEGKF